MEDVLQNAIVAINQMLESCPECSCTVVKNKSKHPSAGHSQMTCQECDHQWSESTFAMDKERVANILQNHGLYEESDAIREMGEAAYKDFITSNLELSEFLH